jgi:hypothetical protein
MASMTPVCLHEAKYGDIGVNFVLSSRPHLGRPLQATCVLRPKYRKSLVHNTA